MRRWLLLLVFLCALPDARAQRQMEDLGRGVVAVRISSTQAYVGWRMLGTDPDDIGFNLYRSHNGGAAVKVNGSPLTVTTDFVDTPPSLSQPNSYHVRPVIDSVEQAASDAFTLPGNMPVPQDHQGNVAPYLSVPLNVPAGGTTPSGSYTYSPNDASVGDLDGDGEYEIVLKWDPSNSKDNSRDGHTGPVYLDAYEIDGTHLWRIDLGRNIRAGAHYTQFMVYDLDGDGRAEVACKTAPGTVDGLGSNVLMGSDDPSIVYTNADGYILAGPEYLTVFDGLTGAELATTNYIVPRHPTNPLNPSSSELNAEWGDGYGNRVDRFLAGIAYLDGIRPSLVMCRGYYTRTTLAAWDWRDGQLTMRWLFDSDDGTPGNSAYEGQGNHQLSIADVDGDGKDEIIYGACSIDDDGSGLYTTGFNHGDALHVSDMDPDRPGIEVWDVHESGPTVARAGEFRDAASGALIYGVAGTGDTGRGLAAHIDGGHVGYQMWSSDTSGVLDRFGSQVSGSRPSINFVVWWDDDLQRELLDNAGGGGANSSLDKWTGSGTARILSPYSVDEGARHNNSTKSNPCLSGDILGDWREEIVCRNADNDKLMIFVSPNSATNRFRTLLHDAQYRVALAWQNTAYNQPPHPSFYIGAGMSDPPPYPVSGADLTWVGDGTANAWDLGGASNWRTGGVWTGTATTTFAQGETVLFDMSGSSSPAVTLSGSLQPGDVKVHSPTDYTFGGGGTLDGTMGLTKTGSGTLTLDTINAFTGATVVWEGGLLVNGSLDQSPVTARKGVGLDARVGGAGVLGQGLTMEVGIVDPGPGPGSGATFTVTGTLTEDGGVANIFDLSDDPSGLVTSNDKILILGDLDVTGVNTVEIRMLNGHLSAGTYSLIEYSGTFSGTLANFQLAGWLPGTAILANPPGAIVMHYTADPDAPTVDSTSPAPGATDVALTADVTVTFNEPMDPLSIDGESFYLKDDAGNTIAATVSYDAGTDTAILEPDAGLTLSRTYTATVAGGPGGVTDVSGNPLGFDYVWSFTATGFIADVAILPDADTYLTNDEKSGPEVTHGHKDQWEVRWYDDGSAQRIRIGYVRYDISGIDPSLFSSATLKGTFTGSSYNDAGTWNVYGLDDDVSGDDWDELTVNYATAAGVDPSAPINAFGFTDATLLGTIDLDGVDVEPLPFASTTGDLDLSAFLQADTDGLITLLFMSDSVVSAGGEYRIDALDNDFPAAGHGPTPLCFAPPSDIVDVRQAAGPSVVVTWGVRSNHTYGVERTTDSLTSSNWVGVASGLPADSVNTYTDTVPVEANVSYRVFDEGAAE